MIKQFLVEKQIQELCTQIAESIEENIEDDNEVVFVCILKGALPFFHEVSKKLSFFSHSKITQVFVKISSYSQDKQTEVITMEILEKDSRVDFRDKKVVVFDELIDSGNTVKYIRNFLQSRETKQSIFVSLLSKLPESELPDWDTESHLYLIGKHIPKETGYLVGFGLDNKERYRGLSEIYLKKS